MAKSRQSMAKAAPKSVQSSSAGNLIPHGFRKGPAETIEGSTGNQRLATSAPANPPMVPAMVNKGSQTTGRSLDPETRSWMESRFGFDFSKVRIHTDPRAAQSAEALNALAYTIGKDIVIGQDQDAFRNKIGNPLLAHELAHVVQQANGGSSADAEGRAWTASRHVLQGIPIPAGLLGGSPISIQKAGKEDASGSSAKVPPVVVVDESTEPAIDEFEFDKADIPPQHMKRLQELRTRLLTSPNAKVVLIGHTDTVGTEKYNLGLGTRRATSVRDFLTKKDETSKQNGVDSSRIEIQSRGETQPAAGQPPAKLDPDQGVKNPKNRRVEIRTTGLAPEKGWTFNIAQPDTQKPPLEVTKLPPSIKYPDIVGNPKDNPPTEKPTTPVPADKKVPVQLEEKEKKVQFHVTVEAELQNEKKAGEPAETKLSRKVTLELTIEADPLTEYKGKTFEVSFGQVEASFALGAEGEKSLSAPGKKVSIKGTSPIGASFTIVEVKSRQPLAVIPKGTTLGIKVGIEVDPVQMSIKAEAKAELKVPLGKNVNFILGGGFEAARGKDDDQIKNSTAGTLNVGIEF
jgi:outer membrane protein OmpA-like peptidoglycan-associated protein